MRAEKPVAVIDIGKTNAKVALIDLADAAEVGQRTAPNAVRADGPYPHYDVARLFDFLCEALSELGREAEFGGVVVTTHGASGALLSGDPMGDGLALPVLDYEHSGPDMIAADYEALRPAFAETLSPRSPGGLNLGAQLFWQGRRFPEAVRSALFVTYPQYWSWRLCGVAANEVSSLGCHTDLWNPRSGGWSSLLRRLQVAPRFAPLRVASDRLASMRPALAARLGLPPDIPVLCGLHDSSAALLPHLLTRQPPFTVVSTGTWTIVFAVGGSLDRLDPARDTLAYVMPTGMPVPAARFMGGREFQRLVGARPEAPGEAAIARVVAAKVMALPSFAPGVGPFPGREGRWSHDPATLPPGERSAAASLYLALVTAEAMACAAADGPVIVEGPFAGNGVYCSALAAILARPVVPSAGSAGTSRGAAQLFRACHASSQTRDREAVPLALPGLPAYVRRWRDEVTKGNLPAPR